MKKFLVIICCLLNSIVLFADDYKAIELKVLYVGIDPSLGIPDYDIISSGNIGKEFYEEDVSLRMDDFKRMLSDYFASVECIDARNYKSSMSDKYDVTVFDAKVSLPYDFSRPAVLIAQNAPLIGESVGLKTDWYCLCLREFALNVKKEHPIFQGPVQVMLTMEKVRNSETIYNYVNGNGIPLEIPMWRVEQNRYEQYRIGMVSHGDGFEDSPDAEFISGGRSLKSIDAVAIGRHGNYLMWGFAASPRYMTDEAKRVFVNAICYINKFSGKTPIARKFEKGVTTKKQIHDNLYVLSKKAYRTYVKRMMNMGKTCLTRDNFIKEYLHPDLYAKFNGSIKSCRKFLKENMDFFYGKNYSFVVDDDVKKLAVNNESVSLLATCISNWKRGYDVELSKRILERYTLENFQTVDGWEKWFAENKSKLFFSEACGYKFIVNDYEKSQFFRVNERENTSAALSQNEPVKFQIKLVNRVSRKGEIQIVGEIMEGFHIYAINQGNIPFIATKIEFILPEGINLVGELKDSSSLPMKGEDNIAVYEDRVVFKQNYEGHAFSLNSKGICRITYQCCNNDICMPPVTKDYEFYF